ncbi:hypothetical protein PVAND_000254 [Polypedilum vanderplanki]|uniref:Uncharacterized protein n=1 Tax=Polypedilum vanderplanki TaxID=319348 RepID=A0A9J6BJI3_POLVA|nr:hypothetical protein PVAND_000254 [Polypedilum vanderplanki]
MDSQIKEEPQDICENEALDLQFELNESTTSISSSSDSSSDSENSETSNESEDDDPDYFPTDREIIEYVRDLIEDGDKTASKIVGKAFKDQRKEQKLEKGDGPISSRTRSKTQN